MPDEKNIVIVGGGVIGCTTAYYLTRHPSYDPAKHTITLIEAVGIASGASGKAGGLLALWAYPSSIVPLSFKLHRELAEEHGGEKRWGYRVVGCGSIELNGRNVEADARVLRRDVGGQNGDVKGVHHEDIAGGDAAVSLQKRSKESHQRLRKVGLPDELDWVAEECVEGYESMGGDGETAQVHPYQFTTSMAELAQEKGLKVILGSVTGIEGEGSEKSVSYTDKKTGEKKTIDATDVVITAGPWSKRVWPGAPISNTRAHSVTIRPSREVSGYCLFTQLGLPKNFKEGSKNKAKFVTPEIYARPNNELYACGEGDHLVPLPQSTADVEVDESRCQDIIDYCASFSDEMKDGEVLVRQACYLPLVETGGGPLIGPTQTEGVYIATGHTCWGISNSCGSGKLMSEYLLDGEPKSANIASLDPRKWLK
jgi:glycine/D-amino acid oxidase-like deaminating enzyme